MLGARQFSETRADPSVPDRLTPSGQSRAPRVPVVEVLEIETAGQFEGCR
jgi:hypothetical protein